MRLFLYILLLLPLSAWAGIDTLKDTSEIYDCTLYDETDCVPEVEGEDCHRYNSGKSYQNRTGTNGLGIAYRTLMQLPGWNDTLPDSSEFKVLCKWERDATDRVMIMFPMTTQWYVGSEAAYNIGNYPDPDSGATWNHAYLDVGDGDSANWSGLGGGDYTVSVACSTTITDTGQYFTFKNFNRILNYWDTSGTNYGFMLRMRWIGDPFPLTTTDKNLVTSEYLNDRVPMAILFYPDAEGEEGEPNVLHGPKGAGKVGSPKGPSNLGYP